MLEQNPRHPLALHVKVDVDHDNLDAVVLDDVDHDEPWWTGGVQVLIENHRRMLFTILETLNTHSSSTTEDSGIKSSPTHICALFLQHLLLV